MTDIALAYQAGVDAVVADNGLNRGGFVDAMQTVITDNFSNAEGNAYVDAVATEFNRLGIINNPSYNNLRANIIADPGVHTSLYAALATSLNALPEAQPVIDAAELTRLRDDRDNINNAIDRLDALITAEPNGTVGRLVKEIMRDGKRQLREYRESVRDNIRNLIGNPDG